MERFKKKFDGVYGFTIDGERKRERKRKVSQPGNWHDWITSNRVADIPSRWIDGTGYRG